MLVNGVSPMFKAARIGLGIAGASLLFSALAIEPSGPDGRFVAELFLQCMLIAIGVMVLATMFCWRP